MLINAVKVNRQSVDERQKTSQHPKASLPLQSSASISSQKINNSLINKRPSKVQSADLSFEGLSSFTATFSEETCKAAEAAFSKKYGTAAQELLSEVRNKPIQGLAEFNKKGELLVTQKKTASEFVENAIYPIVFMPVDLLNATLRQMRKLPFVSNDFGNVGILAKRAQHVDNQHKANVLYSFLKSYDSEFEKLVKSDAKYADRTKREEAGEIIMKRLGKTGHGKVDPVKGNFNVYAERSLNRLVTGGTTALFLANDAYILSRTLSDNHEEARAEKKARLNQEIKRVGLTAYLTYLTLGAFKKVTNKSLGISVCISALTCFASEVYGRLSEGKAVVPITSEDAKRRASKENASKDPKHASTAYFNDLALTNNKQLSKTFSNFTGNIEESKAEKQEATNKKPEHKITIKKVIVGYLLGGVAAGYLLAKGKKIESVDKFLKNISKKYKNVINEEKTITSDEYNAIIKKLQNDGLGSLAEDYNDVIMKYNAKNQNVDNVINLGQVEKKVMGPIIDIGLLGPLKLVKKVVTTPYEISAKFVDLIKNFKKPKTNSDSGEIDLKTAKNAILYLNKHINDADSGKMLSKKILGSLDVINKSNYSASDSSFWTKLIANLVTSYFLIVDNFNTTMIKTKGNDKQLANQKAQERTVQRASQMFYSNYTNKLFSKIFEEVLNRSLLGMSVVAGSTQILGDVLNRLTIGMPLGEATRQQILDKEKRNVEADGLKGKYFRAMAYISGKKRVSESVAAKQDK